MKVAIIQFPGSNCERETKLAVQRAGMQPVEFLWNQPSHGLQDMDAYVIVGGFSYEDRSRAGIIAALDPLMQVIKQQSELGKPVLGICNGAQILVETGLVPGLQDYQIGMSLTENKRVLNGKILGTGFYNTWVHMRTSQTVKANAFTNGLTVNDIMTIPIAHAEGRFVMPNELLSKMEQEGLTVFKYCDERGQVIDNFPINPNGSQHNIAAVINKTGNVMAMMPHPERTEAGDAIFQSMRDYIINRRSQTNSVLDFNPMLHHPTPFVKPVNSSELLIKLIITDNHALTVQNTLRQMGIPVKVKRVVHWQVNTKHPDMLEEIKKTGVIFNDRKEYEISAQDLYNPKAFTYLVQSKDDLLGQQKLQMLKDHFAIDQVDAIYHGVLWQFICDEMPISDVKAAVLQSHIIANPYANTCYEYI